jgi:large subunit ribosomal protein L18
MKENTKKYTVPLRRKREGKTDYRSRIKLVSSGLPRLVVRRTLSKIIAQIAVFDVKGDIIKAGVDSCLLKDYGWKGSLKNIPACYLTGFAVGKKALAVGVNDAVLDIGFSTAINGVKIFAFLKGAVDSGLKVACSEEVFPSQDRLGGKHIKGFENNVEEIKRKIQNEKR